MPELDAVLEAVLFAAGEPVSIKELARVTETEPELVRQGLEHLGQRLCDVGSGLHLLEIAGGWQMGTRPECAGAISRLLSPRANRLSKPALETITIVAYRQPVTQMEIEAIRGVSCDGVLRTLVERELIAEAGRKQTPGRPILYATTAAFLHYFGLPDLESLPPLPEEGDGESEMAAMREAVAAAGVEA